MFYCSYLYVRCACVILAHLGSKWKGLRVKICEQQVTM